MKNPLHKDCSVEGFVAEVLESKEFSSILTGHQVIPGSDAFYSTTTRPWPKVMGDILTQSGIHSLYTHQARAIDIARSGKSVVVATPTASGKSLIYNLPVIERYLSDQGAKSLFLFPLKALAHDQLESFKELTLYWPESARPTAEVYDGDTTPHMRKKIRNNLPSVLFTNPEMLHLSMLPHHHLWATFFAGLSYVVVDEVHTYRGLLGSHMAQLFRRLKRIAALYGGMPTFIFCSATVGNPIELTTKLTGEEPLPVLESGAPQGKRHFFFVNPEDTPSTVAIRLLKAALARGLRTIVYCQSRRMTELISLWASQSAGAYASRISAYRAGYLAEERRDIESRMASGELLAIISTSALELGIDIGNLDVCILVGYPGTVMSTLQRGGRVGRSTQDSAVVLVAQEDALDQYIVKHSDSFFSRPAENAVLNPENPVILARHLECAAAELPLRLDREHDALWIKGDAISVVRDMEKKGKLLRSADGYELIASQKNPQRRVALRGSGATVAIVNEENTVIGSVDGIRAMREAHPGAIYLHRGQYYEVTELDLPSGKAHASKKRPPWYTRPRSTKDTEILSIEQSQIIGGMAVQFGRLRVTDVVTGYEKRAMQSGQLMGVVPLFFEPQVFETEGFWFLVPKASQLAVESAFMHFMGSIHALEHAAIGILPFLVMTDRNDLGGISKPMHLQTGKPTVFVYDGMPGGAGLSRSAFAQAEEMFVCINDVIESCSCELGCPSCVHSPKCGSGNRPIDKNGALLLLKEMMKGDDLSVKEAQEAIAAPLEPASKLEQLSQQKVNAPISWDTVLTDEEHEDALKENVEYFEEQPPSMHEQRLLEMKSTLLRENDGKVLFPERALYSHKKEQSKSIEKNTDNNAAAAASMYASIARAGVGKPKGIPKNTFLPQSNVPAVTGGIQGRQIMQNSRDILMEKKSFSFEALPDHYAVLDVETRYSAKDVGGWHKSHLMGVSIAVVYDSKTDAYMGYTQDAIQEMAEHLKQVPLVVGFNTVRFDYSVLDAHVRGFSFHDLPTLDMLAEVYSQLSYRISLDNLASASLGSEKSANGLQALEWWKEGRLDLIEEYCKKDVQLTKELFLYGRDNGYVLFSNKAGQRVRVRATWSPHRE